jgi:hypothetical protein
VNCLVDAEVGNAESGSFLIVQQNAIFKAKATLDGDAVDDPIGVGEPSPVA